MEYKFQIQELLGIAMILVVLSIGVAYGLQVMGDIRDDMGVSDCAARSDGFTTYVEASKTCSNGTTTRTVGTATFNSSSDGIEAIAKIPEKLPMIVTVIVAAVIIGILLTYLYGRFVK